MSGCIVCGHPARRDIEAALAAGESPATVAERYGVERLELLNHYLDHSSGPLPEVLPEPAVLLGQAPDW
jgi:hypothetical protein